MTWTNDRVLRGANEGNYNANWLNIASQVLVVVRNKKSLTVAFLGKMPAYTVH